MLTSKFSTKVQVTPPAITRSGLTQHRHCASCSKRMTSSYNLQLLWCMALAWMAFAWTVQPWDILSKANVKHYSDVATNAWECTCSSVRYAVKQSLSQYWTRRCLSTDWRYLSSSRSHISSSSSRKSRCCSCWVAARVFWSKDRGLLGYSVGSALKKLPFWILMQIWRFSKAFNCSRPGNALFSVCNRPPASEWRHKSLYWDRKKACRLMYLMDRSIITWTRWWLHVLHEMCRTMCVCVCGVITSSQATYVVLCRDSRVLNWDKSWDISSILEVLASNSSRR